MFKAVRLVWNNHHESFDSLIVDQQVWFEDVEVEGRSEEAPVPGPFIPIRSEQPVPQPG